jgi:hypothetical protein
MAAVAVVEAGDIIRKSNSNASHLNFLNKKKS